MTSAQEMEVKKTRQDELLDELLKGCENPQGILEKGGLVDQLKKRLVERVLNAELTHHLGYDPHEVAGRGSGNSRNGKGKKRVQGGEGEFEIEVPRDRNGTFDPVIVPKRQRRIAGFDEKVLALYARGLST